MSDIVEILGVAIAFTLAIYGVGYWAGKLASRLASFDKRLAALEHVDSITTDLLIRRATVEALNTGLIVPDYNSQSAK